MVNDSSFVLYRKTCRYCMRLVYVRFLNGVWSVLDWVTGDIHICKGLSSPVVEV